MDVQLSCRSCHMTCRSVTCFKEHLVPQGKRKESSCDRWWKCVGCMKVLDRKVRDPKDHVCEERWCKSCKKYGFNDHMCYMRAIENKRSLPRFIFFDFECTQSDRIFLHFAGFTYIHENQIHHHGITPLWPQANAEVEKQNQSLLKRIIIAHTEKKHWKDELDTYLMMFRSSPHCVT